jgi:hypothetical protein
VRAATASARLDAMLGTIARVALMRVLPRKLIPVLTAWQIISMIRGRKNRSADPATTTTTSTTRRTTRR